MDKNLRKAIYSSLGAVVILALFVTYVGWADILRALLSASPKYLVLGFITSLGIWIAWSASWLIVLGHVGHNFTLTKHLMLFFGGLFANNITPMGRMGGEPFMAWLISKNSDVNYEKSLGAVFTADVINQMPFFTLSVAGLMLFLAFNKATPIIRLISLLLLVVGVIISSFIFIAWTQKNYAQKIAVYLGSIVSTVLDYIGFLTSSIEEKLKEDTISKKVDTFYKTIHSVVSTKSKFIKIVALSHIAWILQITVLYFFLLSVGWRQPSYILIMLVLPISALGSNIPSPGGSGGFEVFLIFLLIVIAGVPASQASVAAILYRTATYVVPTIVGGICVFELSTGAAGIRKIFEKSERYS